MKSTQGAERWSTLYSLRKVSIRPLAFAIRGIWESSKGWNVLSLLLILAQSVLPLMGLYLIKMILDTVANSVKAGQGHDAVHQVLVLVAFSGLVTLATAVCNNVSTVVTEIQVQNLADHLQEILHRQSVDVDLAYYENAEYYDSLHRAQQEARSRPLWIVFRLSGTVQGATSLLVLGGLLASLHWGIILLLLATAVPGVIFRIHYADVMYHWVRQSTAAERKAGYLSELLTRSTYAKEVRLLDLGPVLMERFAALRSVLKRDRLAIFSKCAITELASEAVGTAAVCVFFGFVTYRTLSGAASLGELVMYFQGFQRAQASLREMLKGVAGLYEDNLFLSSVLEFLNVKPQIGAPAGHLPMVRPIQDGITFDKVSFRYPGSKRWVLQNITFSIRRGESVALVGENGSGKTTLVKLLVRLHDPNEGSIRMDGADIRQFDPPALRAEIGVVLQDYVRFDLTAFENVSFGNVRVEPSKERVVAAASRADANYAIERLPQGYDTILGRRFDGGEELSGGEWQKVALARAFYRDAQVLVLDEPTASMDARSEAGVFEAFRELTLGKISLVISHRFSTVRAADRILVLDAGRIIEQGTHDELMELNGKYAHMFRIQSEPYL